MPKRRKLRRHRIKDVCGQGRRGRALMTTLTLITLTTTIVVPAVPLTLSPAPKETGEGSCGLPQLRDLHAQKVRVRRLHAHTHTHTHKQTLYIYILICIEHTPTHSHSLTHTHTHTHTHTTSSSSATTLMAAWTTVCHETAATDARMAICLLGLSRKLVLVVLSYAHPRGM